MIEGFVLIEDDNDMLDRRPRAIFVVPPPYPPQDFRQIRHCCQRMGQSRSSFR